MLTSKLAFTKEGKTEKGTGVGGWLGFTTLQG